MNNDERNNKELVNKANTPIFREMRKKDRSVGADEIQRILESCEHGMLATKGNGEFPYVIPLNYIFLNGKIYIHCTNKESHKLDDIRENHNVCFTVVGQTELMPEIFSTCYESVVIFGTAAIVEDDTIKQMALEGLLKKYSADFMEKGITYIKKLWDATAVVEISPLHVTGKMRRRN